MDQVLNSQVPLTAQQPKRVVNVEMFRAGPQISSTGQKMMFSEDDLDQVVGSYDPATHEAPLIIGHDQEDGTPALGWVRGLWRKGKELWGKVELTPKAEQLIKDGVFKKVSSSFYLPDAETNPTPGSLSLRHLGLVSIPAVKGLTAFAEGLAGQETVTITPSEWGSSISFKETSETKPTMARKKNATSPISVDHADGGPMTVHINIGSGQSKPNLYDGDGNRISETGAPADYDMDYGDMDADPEMVDPNQQDQPGPGMSDMDPTHAPMGESPQGEDEDYVEGPDGDNMGTEDDGSAKPVAEHQTVPGSGGGGTPPTDSEDISGDVEGDDKVASQLASQYTEEQLIKALYSKTSTASMMEGMSYSECGEDDDEKEDYSESDDDENQPSREKEEEKGGMFGENEEDEEDEDEDEDEKDDDEWGGKSDHAECGGVDANPAPMTAGTKPGGKSVSEAATGSRSYSEPAVRDRGLQARVAELEEELARQKKLMREKEITDFAESVYDTGRLTAQIVPPSDLVRFMETLNSKNTVNFSEAGKTSQYDFFKSMLENLPAMVSFEEVATKTSAPAKKSAPKPTVDGYVYDPRTSDLHAQALEYSESKGVTYEIALRNVLSEN
jgi:hypothetical protein